MDSSKERVLGEKREDLKSSFDIPMTACFISYV